MLAPSRRHGEWTPGVPPPYNEGSRPEDPPLIALEVEATLPPHAEAAYALGVVAGALGLAIAPDAPLRVVYSADAPAATPEAPVVWIPYRETAWGETRPAAPTTCRADGPGRWTLDADLAACAFAHLTLRTESAWPRDGHDRPVPDAASFAPVLDEAAEVLMGAVRQAAAAADVPLVRLSPWPDGHAMAAALTHDVDRVYAREPFKLAAHAVGALRAIARGRTAQAMADARELVESLLGQPRPGADFQRLMALESGEGVHSTFYFLGGPRWTRYGTRYHLEDEVVEAIATRLRAAGHELGVHGTYAPGDDPARYRADRQAHADAFDALPDGIRNHYLRFDGTRTWAAQKAAGFSYDATLGHAAATGYRAGTAFPFAPYDADRKAAMAFTALPLAVMDGTLFEYLGLDEAGAWEATRQELEAASRVGGLAVLLWHNNYFGTRRFASWEAVYLRAVQDLKARGAWVAPAGEIAGWWRDRAALRMRLQRTDDSWTATLSHPTGLSGAELEVEDHGQRRIRLGTIAAGQELTIALTEATCAS